MRVRGVFGTGLTASGTGAGGGVTATGSVAASACGEFRRQYAIVRP